MHKKSFSGKALFFSLILVSFTTVFAQGFSDNHNDNVLTGWTSTGARSWTEGGGVASPAASSNSVGMLINNYACTNDGTLEVVMTSDQWNGQFGGVILRYASTTSFIFVTVRPADQWGSYIKAIPNSTNPDGTGTTVASGFTIGTTFTLRVVASGSTFRCYINNNLMGTFTDANHPSGKVGYGYYSQWNQYTTYDNITWTDGSTPNYTLSVTSSSGGSVSPSSGTYPSGTSVTLTATPSSGYRFVSWGGDLTGSTNPATIVMNSNKTITATFELIPVNYTLSVTSSSGGSVSPSSGTYPSGTSVTLTARPSSGYRFVSWSGDLTGSTNPATIVMNSNKTITATFELIPVNYTLSVTSSSGGSVSPSSGTYPSGTSVTLTATPSSGYRFVSWSGDLTGSTNPATIVMNSNKTITATFELIPVNYTLSVTSSSGGSVSPSSGTYPSGTSVTLTATPSSGYRFVSWGGSLTGSQNPATIIMNSNKTITATFVANQVKPNAQKLTITARVFDNSGNPLGTPDPVSLDATIRLYDRDTVGTVMYTETFYVANNQAISVSNGNFVARLGEGTTSDTLRSVIGRNQNLWAEIQIGGDILKRSPLTAAAYSIANQ